jgi:Mobilization protein NikA
MSGYACGCADCTAKRNNRQGSEKRQRTQSVLMRVTPAEHAALDAEASRLGVSMAELLRRGVAHLLPVSEQT